MKLKERIATSLRQAGSRRVELCLPRGWPESNSAVRWHIPGGGSDASGRIQSLEHLPDNARGAPLHVWTPASETLLTHTSLPTRSRARILQALPYALEEQLLDEPEHLHFAYVREPTGDLAVAVTQRKRVTAWLDALGAAGVKIASMCPAHLALPLQSNAWSMAFVDDELWVRTGAFSGFTMLATTEPPPLLSAAIREAEAEQRSPQHIMVFRPPGMLNLEAWSAALRVSIVAESNDFWDMTSVPALNLLQAEFSGTGQIAHLAKPLRPALILLAIWLVGGFAVDVAEWFRLRNIQRTQTAEMQQIYRDVFGTASPQPFGQMKKSIELLEAGGGGPADLLPLLARMAPTLQAQQPRVKLSAMRYSERSLTVDLVLPDSQTLDMIKTNLQSAKLDVEVLNANRRTDGVEGRIRIKPAGAAPRRAS